MAGLSEDSASDGDNDDERFQKQARALPEDAFFDVPPRNPKIPLDPNYEEE
jgi:hypothetical protein